MFVFAEISAQITVNHYLLSKHPMSITFSTWNFPPLSIIFTSVLGFNDSFQIVYWVLRTCSSTFHCFVCPVYTTRHTIIYITILYWLHFGMLKIKINIFRTISRNFLSIYNTIMFINVAVKGELEPSYFKSSSLFTSWRKSLVEIHHQLTWFSKNLARFTAVEKRLGQDSPSWIFW